MPKVGMEPLRREQIQTAAARVISSKGFIRTTIADVAKEAGVSTGMINHYYKNKSHMLVETLNYVSDQTVSDLRRQCAREESATARLRLLARRAISQKGKNLIGTRVWAWAIAEAMVSKQMAQALQERRATFQELILEVISGLPAAEKWGGVQIAALAAELDAYLTGLTVYVVSGGPRTDVKSVEDSLIAMVMHRSRA